MSFTDSSSPVAQDTKDLEALWDDIKKKFNTRDKESTPTMVFSVIGDSDSYVSSPWPKPAFKTALIEASKRGGETVILFRGNCGGVSSVVRHAYQLYEDMEFGNKREEINDSERHIKLVSMTEKKQPTERSLHTTNTFENEKIEEFIFDFEKFVSEQEIFYFGESIKFKIPVPIVILVCEGDIMTISHISKALQNKLPVIIMKGSGNAADFVFDLINNNSPKFKVKEHLQNVSIVFNIDLDDPNYSNLAKDLNAIRKNRDLIGVLDLDRDDPHMLSSIVGKALVSCWSLRRKKKKSNIGSDVKEKEIQTKGTNNPTSQLATNRKCFDTLLSSFFNCMDSIDGSQLLKGLKWGSRQHETNPKTCTSTSLPLYFYFGYQILQETKQIKERGGEVFLLEALKANRCDYVRVLLDQGVKFNINDLSELYEQTITCQECMLEKKECLHLTWILNQIPEAKALCLHLLQARNITVNGKETEGFCSKDLCLDLLKARNTCTCMRGKAPEEKPNQCVRKAAKKLCCEIMQYNVTNMPEETCREESIADVLLWAILANRQELAEICWLGGKDYLMTGLVCSAILEKLSEKVSDVNEQVLSKDLEEHSKIFQQRCISVMDDMSKGNNKESIDLMGTETVIWGIHSSPLTFAYEHFMYDVVAHPCSQKYMNNQWLNRESSPQSALNKTTNFICAPRTKFFSNYPALNKKTNFICAPRTKFFFNYVMFFLVLAMYSDFVLTSISPPFYDTTKARVFEYSMYIWGAGDLIEELIACFGWGKEAGRPHRSFWTRFYRHIQDFWNVVDLLSYLLLTIGLCVRHAYPDQTYTFARHVFGLSLIAMYLRILELVLIFRVLGPTLIVIKEMLRDLLRFLFIAGVVVLGVGIYKHATTWPDCQRIWSDDLTKWRIWNIIYYGYSQLYDAELDFFDNQENCTNKGTLWKTNQSQNQSSRLDWGVEAIVGVYMLILNYVLANLIIAMFGYSYETVQVDAEKLWRFQRYTVIYDYTERILSPFTLIIRPIELVIYLRSKFSCDKKVCHAENHEQKKEISTSKENNLVQK